MRGGRWIGGLAAIVVLAGGVYAVVGHQQGEPTVTCRDLLDATTRTLPTAVVRDLGAPVFDVDTGELSLPTASRVDGARQALQQEDWPQKDALVCGLPTASSLLFVRQADVPREPCYGSAAQCAGEPTERRTCVAVFSFVTRGTHWLHDERCPRKS